MIGQTLGPYKIVEQIGSGGMATVYKAYHPAMDRHVAVKVLPPNMAQDPQFATRFAQEARTIARLEHPFILPVYDSGNEGGTAYLVMRYMETGTLTDLLSKGRPPLRYSVRLIQRIAEALDHAHSQGIVHRDLKPSNILIDKNGQPYLTDFGIAKILEGSLNLTGSGIIGTPAYMSPEQGQGIRVDPRSDIYSLGVVLYELVTGQRPFEADTPMGVLFKHIQEPLPPPSSIARDIPPQLEAVIMKALAKDRGQRYQTAGEFAHALEDVLSGMSQTREAAPPQGRQPAAPGSPPRTPPPQPSTVGPTVRDSASTEDVRPRRTIRAAPLPPDSAARKEERDRRRPNWLLLLGCAGLGIVGVIAVALGAIYFLPGLIPSADTGAAATATFAAAFNAALATANARVTAAPAGVTQPVSITNTAPPAIANDTATAAPSETPGPSGCTDNAQFAADVTIPDNTRIAPNTGFTKTWRVENTGTCTWDTTYSLRFAGGVQMNGPGSVPFPGAVSPGAAMDISVNLVAPAAPGNYKGQWLLTNASGEAFDSGPTLTVIIVVPATPTPTPTPTATLTATPTATATSFIIVLPPGGFKLPKTITLNPASSGGVYSPPATVFGAPNAGDDESNHSRQGFVTFDLGSIPSGATITAVKLDLTPYDTLGNPFSLGCLRAYQQNYGSLDAGDFFSGTASGALWRFCSAGDLTSESAQTMESSGLASVQSSLASGRFQIRLQFNEQASNGNGAADLLRPSPKLIVTYTGP